MKLTKKTIVRLVLGLLLLVTAYPLSFGAVEAFVIRSQDYMAQDTVQHACPQGVAGLYYPLVLATEKVGGSRILFGYVGCWYDVRHFITGPFGFRQPYAVPKTKRESVEPSVGSDSSNRATSILETLQL